jgi:hypothetical protein
MQTTIGDFQIAADDREQVVEVVRHAAGQLPDCFLRRGHDPYKSTCQATTR